ncbi:MAG: type II toxin-antitoxin system RelE/ParE family toxin [Geminicoccaceae bacterium]
MRSYKDKKTQHFAEGHRVPQFEPFRRQAEKRLRALEAAVTLLDLRALPGNRLEALKGDRKGQYSIRINDQWRICFEWRPDADGPENVEITDYH